MSIVVKCFDRDSSLCYSCWRVTKWSSFEYKDASPFEFFAIHASRPRRDGANSNFAMEFLGDFQIFIGSIHRRMSRKRDMLILYRMLTAAAASLLFARPHSPSAHVRRSTRICNRADRYFRHAWLANINFLLNTKISPHSCSCYHCSPLIAQLYKYT